MVNDDLIQAVEDWFHDRKVAFDPEAFAELLEEWHFSGSVDTLELFMNTGDLSELLDYYSWTIDHEGLDVFLESLGDLRIYGDADELVNAFIEAYSVPDEVSAYLDDERIVRDFVYAGGFRIGSFYLEA